MRARSRRWSSPRGDQRTGRPSPAAGSSPIHAERAELQSIELIHSALGPYRRAITTEIAQAKAYFNQGMQLKYAFGMDYAARSFREAQRHDPDCAIAYWGEAWALGPTINCQHRSVDRSEVSVGIHTRIRMLSGWIRDLATAPLAIATSSQEWKEELAQFIQNYESGCFDGFLRIV